MSIFRKSLILICVLTSLPRLSDGVTPDTFSSVKPLAKWSVAHFRGDASIIMSVANDKNNPAAQLTIHGNGSICDSFYTSFPALTGKQKPMEVSFRYKTNDELAGFVALSAGKGCTLPWVRRSVTYKGDNEWHEFRKVLDVRYLSIPSPVLELLFDCGDTKDGCTILIDDVRVMPVDPDGSAGVKWRSPGSHVLIDKTPSQNIILDLSSPEEKVYEIRISSVDSKQTIFQQSLTVDGRKTFQINAEKFAVGTYTVLVMSGETKINSWQFTKYPWRENSVLIHDGVPYVNGKPFLVLGLYHTSDVVIDIINKENEKLSIVSRLTRDSVFKDVADHGFNTVHYTWGVAPADFYQKANEHGLWVLSESVRSFDKVNQVKDQPNIFGWYGLDEAKPEVAEECADTYKRYKELDPYHPVMSAFCYGGGGYNSWRLVDIAMPDPYPFNGPGIDFGSTFQFHMESDRDLLLDNDPTTCIIFVPQLFTCDGWGGYVPTYDQVRAQVYTALHYGAKGIFYYAFWTHEILTKGMELNPARKHWFIPESSLWDQIGKLNRELMEMKNVILFGRPDSSIRVKPMKSVLGRCVVTPNHQRYVILVNTGPEKKQGIIISGLKPSERLVAQYNSSVAKSASSGKSIVNLKAYSVGVYFVENRSEEHNRH